MVIPCMATHPISQSGGWACRMVVAKGPYPHRRPSRGRPENGPPVRVGYDPLAPPHKH
ncbi:hypothetical protein Hanom_Chr11g01000151 [Helianthus anomalus]